MYKHILLFPLLSCCVQFGITPVVSMYCTNTIVEQKAHAYCTVTAAQKKNNDYFYNKAVSRNTLRIFSYERMQSYLDSLYVIESPSGRKIILNQFDLYQYDAFIEVIKTFPEYYAFIQRLAKRMYKVSSLKFYSVWWHGLEKKILRLKDEAINAQKEEDQKNFREPILKRERDDYIAKTSAVMRSQSSELDYCKKEYQKRVELGDLSDDQRALYVNRIRCIDQSGSQMNSFFDSYFYISPETVTYLESFFESKDIAKELSHCYGNSLQHLVHKECIDVLNVYVRSHKRVRIKSVHELMMDSVTAGYKLSQSGHITQAFSCLDVCFAIADFSLAVGEGVLDGVSNIIDIALHPIQTVQNTVYGVANISYYVGKMLHDLGAIGINYCIDPQKGAEEWDAYCNGVIELYEVLSEQLQEITFHDAVRMGTAFVVETVLMTRLLSSAHKVCRIAKNNCTQFLKTQKAESVVILTAEGIPITIPDLQVQKFNAVAREVVLGPAKYIELMCMDVMQKVRQDIATLRLLFDNTKKGFAEFANKYIKIEYEHILGINVRFSKKGMPKIDGFHHDFMGRVERSGLFEFVDKVETKSGFYKARILHKGNIAKETATFFPKDWSREKVLNTIFGAYENFIKSGQKMRSAGDGKYLIDVVIEKGVKLRMHITKKGLLTSAYPIFE